MIETEILPYDDVDIGATHFELAWQKVFAREMECISEEEWQSGLVPPYTSAELRKVRDDRTIVEFVITKMGKPPALPGRHAKFDKSGGGCRTSSW